MPKTRLPERGILTTRDTIKGSLSRAEPSDFEPPRTSRPDLAEAVNLTYKKRLQRRLRMADLALEKYERKLEQFHKTGNPNHTLTPEEERLFLAHQDSVRKLEATLAQLEHKDKTQETTDLDTALMLYDAGDSFEEVCQQMSYNPNLPKLLREALDERERKK